MTEMSRRLFFRQAESPVSREISLVQDKHAPHAFADDEIALAMSRVGAIFDLLWAIVD
jgi:hypothetical protein